MIDREHVEEFEKLDVELRIRLLLLYIQTLREGMVSTGKLVENTDINVALKKAYIRLEKEMNI